MKILLVTEDVPAPNLGGAGRHAITLGNALIRHGHEVELLGRAGVFTEPVGNDFDGQLHGLMNFRGSGWQEHRFGAFLPYRRHHIALRIWEAIKKLDYKSFDVIHYHGHVVELGAVIPAEINFVHTLHDQGSDCIKLTRFYDGASCQQTNAQACAMCASARPNVLQAYLSKTAAMVHRDAAVHAFSKHKAVFVSRFVQDQFLKNVAQGRAINSRVIHNFIPAKPASVVMHQDGQSQARILLAGRVDIYKGFTEFFDHVSDELLARYQFRLAGDGPDMARLLKRPGDRKFVRLGFLSAEQINSETAAAIATVVPSIWDEPCATTILEGLANGKRVFALRKGGSPELVLYQKYPDQLVLANTMRELVDALAAAVMDSAVTEANDLAVVDHKIASLIDFYKEIKA
jgi:glycosyltransferase involved in cell wall biosynthesis